MKSSLATIELVGEMPGFSDTVALRSEIDRMRDQLTGINDQMALERKFADEIQRARAIAVIGSPALGLLFDVENTDSTRVNKTMATGDKLESAFFKSSDSVELPDGFAKGLAKQLRVSIHPDKGNSSIEAAAIADILEDTESDPIFSISRAMLSVPVPETATTQELRDERYRLSIALASSRPYFDSPESAEKHAGIEIEGAEWRMRTQAAFKCFDLIVGDNEALSAYVNSIAREKHMPSIQNINLYLPAILSVRERIAKGDPVALDDSTIEFIDAVFERIWTTLKKDENSLVPYQPPYANWLSILLPAMQKLDPGKKAGEEYTDFQPPLRIQRAQQARQSSRYPYKDDLGLMRRQGEDLENTNYSKKIFTEINNKNYDYREKY